MRFGSQRQLTDEQLTALTQGVPWQRMCPASVILVFLPQAKVTGLRQHGESSQGLWFGLLLICQKILTLACFTTEELGALATELMMSLDLKNPRSYSAI